MDHVSNLPDEVLCHILSFLTTNEAALTSILSKRWRNLFALVPNLDFDDYASLNPKEGIRKRNELRQSFMDFVDRVLTLQGNSPIKKFSLKCINNADPDRVDTWISTVLARGVLEFDLSIAMGRESVNNYRRFPKCFESKKLVKLEISYGIDICFLYGSIFLPMLKTLVLDSVEFYDDKFEILLQALPVLEELVLADINRKDWDVTLSSASLKTLTVDYDDCVGTFSFDTPSLVHFCYSDYVAKDYSLVTMENLFDARISLLVDEDETNRARAANNDWLEDDEDNVVLRFANVGKIMNGIRNVQYLDLSANTLEVLSQCCESMPVFNNLKKLAIKSDESRGWQAMPVLLRNCPYIETLIFEGLLHYVTDKCGDACDCVSREDKGSSLTSCSVKVLEIQRFRGTMKEIHMMKHFLDYFPCLKEIKIYIEVDDPTHLKVLEESEVIAEKMELYNKLSSCNVQLLVGGCLYKKWTAQ